MNVYSSSTKNHQKLEATTTSFSEWMGKQTLLEADNGLFLSNKSNQLPMHATAWMKSPGNYAERKKPVSKIYMLYESVYMKFSKRYNYSDIETGSVVARV